MLLDLKPLVQRLLHCQFLLVNFFELNLHILLDLLDKFILLIVHLVLVRLYFLLDLFELFLHLLPAIFPCIQTPLQSLVLPLLVDFHERLDVLHLAFHLIEHAFD